MIAIYWDPKPEIFVIPYLHWPVLWYGVLFALGFMLGFPLFVDLLTRFLKLPDKKKATAIADRLTLYMVLGTVIGARLGHFLFYERPTHYLQDPLAILRIWEGGLASHGGAIGIVLALLLFTYRMKKEEPWIDSLLLLDLIAIPAALGAFFIRVGNFMNQEVLGKPTSLPWAVTFGHPADHSLPMPRHPVQLYEAFFYLAVFLLLWVLSFRPSFLYVRGKILGLFLVLVFGFRFFVEFFKEEQSSLLTASSLTMGQWLSLPAILIGLTLFFYQPFKR